MRDICAEFPAHDKIPDICVKMIRRVNDEEGIQKLVMEVFMTMWFTPCKENDTVNTAHVITIEYNVIHFYFITNRLLWIEKLCKLSMLSVQPVTIKAVVD